MANIAIVYESKGGHTEQYAKWIKEEIGEADIIKADSIKSADRLLGYDFILFGSGIYGEKISIVNFIKKNYKMLKFKKCAVMAVGATEGESEYSNYLKKKNFSEEMQRIRLFCVRGGIDMSKLGAMDKLAMTAQHGKLMKKPDKSNEELMVLGLLESKKNFTAKESAAPLIEYITSGGWKLN